MDKSKIPKSPRALTLICMEMENDIVDSGAGT